MPRFAMAVTANRFRIPSKLLAHCFAHGRETYPREACGVLSGPAASPGAISKAHRIANILDALHRRDPEHFRRTARTGYVLDPSGYLTVERALEARGHRIKAVYHTHVDVGAYFSAEDRKRALWDGKPIFAGVFFLVCAVKNGEPDGAVIAYFDEEHRAFTEVRLNEQGRPLP